MPSFCLYSNKLKMKTFSFRCFYGLFVFISRSQKSGYFFETNKKRQHNGTKCHWHKNITTILIETCVFLCRFHHIMCNDFHCFNHMQFTWYRKTTFLFLLECSRFTSLSFILCTLSINVIHIIYSLLDLSLIMIHNYVRYAVAYSDNVLHKPNIHCRIL